MDTQQHSRPHNLAAEEGLLSFALINPDKFSSIEIDAREFYIERHQVIWETLTRLNNLGQQADYIAVLDDLDNRGKLKMVGGAAYITELSTRFTIGFDPENSARIIREHAQRRELFYIGSEMASAALNEQKELNIETYITALSNSARITGGAVHWSHYLTQLFEEIETRHNNPTDVWGIPTGFGKFDEVTGGLQQSEIMYLSGSPGMGKSIWAMQAAEQMAHKEPGAIYSLEMGGRQVMRRIVSSVSKVSTRRMKTGRLDDGDWPGIIEAIGRLEKLPVYMSDATGWTVTGLRADLSRLKAAQKIKWFVFDYLMLMDDRAQDEIEKTANVSRGLKQICRSLDLAGLVVHSMNKGGQEAAIPGQQHLRGSGQVSFDADLICMLTEFKPMDSNDRYIKPDEVKNMRTLFFAKGRELENPRKYIHMVKQPGFPAFGDYAETR